MADTFNVSISLDETVRIIKKSLDKEMTTLRFCNEYTVQSPDGKRVFVLQFDKRILFTYSSFGITAVIDEFENKTRVHCSTNLEMDGENIFGECSFGATARSIKKITKDLKQYRI